MNDLPSNKKAEVRLENEETILIAAEKTSRKQNVLENYWTLMSTEQIREVEMYNDNGTDRYEFTEMFADLLSIVP